MADELAEGAAIYAPPVARGYLDERTFHDLDLHSANLADPALVSRPGSVSPARFATGNDPNDHPLLGRSGCIPVRRRRFGRGEIRDARNPAGAAPCLRPGVHRLPLTDDPSRPKPLGSPRERV